MLATVRLTGIATTLVGLVPPYDSIGMWGAVILTLLRMIQGIGVGGEWGGSVLLAMEWARHHGQRGLVAASAIRGPGGSVPRDPSDIGFQRLVGGSVPQLGLAHPLR